MPTSEKVNTEHYSLCWLVINSVRHNMGLPVNKFERILSKDNEYHKEITSLLRADYSR